MEIIDKLLDINAKSRCGKKIGKITKIVCHYVGNPNSTAIANRNYFNRHERYASAHYIVGLQGEVIRCIPDGEIAWHGNNENDHSIGIEICHPDSTGKFSEVTRKSVVELCAELCRRYNLNPLSDIIRHYDCSGANHKVCPKYWVDNVADFTKFKQEVDNMLKSKEPNKTRVQNTTEFINALHVLMANGIITNPDVWKGDTISKKNIESLIIKVANKIK